MWQHLRRKSCNDLHSTPWAETWVNLGCQQPEEDNKGCYHRTSLFCGVYARHMEQILLTVFKQFLVFTKWWNSLTLFKCSSAVQNQLPNAHTINDPFLTDDTDHWFDIYSIYSIYCMLLLTETDFLTCCRHEPSLNAIISSRKIWSWMLPVINRDVVLQGYFLAFALHTSTRKHLLWIATEWVKMLWLQS